MLSGMISDLSGQLGQIQSNLNKLIVVRDALAEVIPAEDQLELEFEVVTD